VPRDITVADLKRMHDAAETFVLLDVREDDELAKASLPWAKHVPMGEIPERLSEVPTDSPVVVMCHGGMRSKRVATYLRENGYHDVANLTGGIDAWSEQIDPTIPTY
jgi:rhodanese-related sulfurtransferase